MDLKWPKWTGKPQRPVETSGNQHDCPEFGNGGFGKNDKWVKIIKKDLEFCEYCDNWLLTKEAHEKYPLLNYTSREDHLRMFHPNGEILDWIDWRAIGDEQKDVFRLKHGIPKRSELYSIV